MSEAPVGVVLAGGAGRRIGGAKATVELARRPLLHYPLAALGEVLADLAVVCKEDTVLPALPPGVAIWCDGDPARHPLVGVAAALRTAAGRPVVVCAGDMPFVSADVVRALVAAGPAVAVVTRVGGRLQPLLARYAPEALAVLEAREPGEPVTAVVERLDPVVIDVADELVAFNVNAPEDVLLAEHAATRRTP